MKQAKRAISASEAEMLAAIKCLTEVHGPASVGKFKDSINTILFRCVLHADPIDQKTEKAIADLYEIACLFNKIEEYQSVN
jgi:hypothetical protein